MQNILPPDNPETKLQEGKPPTPADAPPAAIISADTKRGDGVEKARIPQSQSRTKKWPVLDTGVHPPESELTPDVWKFSLDGLLDEPLAFTWDEFQALPRTQVFADMHCVTRWSRLGNVWEGVSTREVLKHVKLKPDAKFVLVQAYDRAFSFFGGASHWTTNLPLEYFLDEDCLFADTHDGEPISLEHGGPLRLVIPKLYAWKSAKWVRGVEFRATDTPGYWERGGYHMLGDPWKEQRYRE
ncbi:MAG: sulfite oxidase-like oxidoreductase [Armatimonadetes bacterium]|nr:sulfite oxidase-like oxidoreductase [Armatimonadota bacterium]